MAGNGNGKGKRKAGRPPKTVNYEQVYELRKIGCTDEEMASILSVSVEWMRQHKATDPQFLEAYEKGWSELKSSLRRRMLDTAFSNSPQAATMQIWISKNILGWTDKQAHTGADGGPIRVELSDAAQRIRDQLRKARPEATE